MSIITSIIFILTTNHINIYKSLKEVQSFIHLTFFFIVKVFCLCSGSHKMRLIFCRTVLSIIRKQFTQSYDRKTILTFRRPNAFLLRKTISWNNSTAFSSTSFFVCRMFLLVTLYFSSISYLRW